MKKLAIVGDSSHDLTFELGEKYGVEILSYYIQLGERHLKDLIEITSAEFYEVCDNYDKVTTGIPSTQDAFDLLDKIKDKGFEEALLIATSSKLTGMYNLFHTVQSTYKDMKLHVFNTNDVGAGSGLMSIYAAQLRDQGLDAESIINKLESKKEKLHTYALFRTLSYLVKGGRFNKYAGALGNFLHINPLLYVDDGAITVSDKIRGKKKSLKALAEHARMRIGDAKKFRLIIFAGNNGTEKAELRLQLKDLIERAEIFFETDLTPALGVHGGPRSIGFSVMLMDE